jgi:glycosyltransferase involved in cell wall biosynthesis
VTRVLVVAEQLRRTAAGGIGTYVSGLLRGVAHSAHEADVDVTAFASRRRRGPDPIRELGVQQRSSPLPGPALTRLWDRGWRAPRGYDVVHAASLAFPGADPLVVTVHDLAWRVVPDAFPERGRRWHEAALQRALSQASAFVVPSVDTADAVAAAAPRPVRIEVIEHGSDHLPAPADAVTDVLLRWLDVRGPFLLTVGTLEPRKNLRRLLRAYVAVRPSLPEPWPLVVVGPEGWGELGAVPAGVVRAGPVRAAVLASLYRRARCLAYVPLLEGFGLPVVEAMRARLPVVSSPLPAAAGATRVVDPGDVDAIAYGLLKVSTDEAVRRELIAAGARRADGLTWATTARHHAALWRELAERR